MIKDNDNFQFAVRYNEEERTMKIAYHDTENAIVIPSDMYLSFISVLIKAGQDFQNRKVVDLGFSQLAENGEDQK